MTFSQLQQTLPNGLHDAELWSFEVDYRRREAVLGIDVDLGGPKGNGHEDPYRPARVRFLGLQFLVVDPPSGYDYGGPSSIDAGEGQPSTQPCELPAVAEGAFLCWLFVVDWNSFIRIAAKDVELEWIAETNQAPSR